MHIVKNNLNQDKWKHDKFIGVKLKSRAINLSRFYTVSRLKDDEQTNVTLKKKAHHVSEGFWTLKSCLIYASWLLINRYFTYLPLYCRSFLETVILTSVKWFCNYKPIYSYIFMLIKRCKCPNKAIINSNHK